VFARLSLLDDIELRLLVGGSPAADGDLDVTTLYTLSFSVRGRSFVFHPGIAKRIADLDVLVVEGSIRVFTSLGLAITRRLHGLPIVWWTSMYDPSRERVSLPRGVRRIILRAAMQRADAILCYSTAAADLLRPWIRHSERVFVAPNVLDTHTLQSARRRWLERPADLTAFARETGLADRSVLLFVGRLSEQKRVAHLLRAFAIVRRERSSLSPLLAIVGEGSERESLSRLAEDLGLTADVKFVGEIRDIEAVCPYFLCSRALVLPGAGGLAIYHALANGLPAIATFADGTEGDLIDDGRTGFLCSPGDLSELASRILRVLDWTDDEWARASGACMAVAHGDAHVDHMIRGFRDAALFAAASSRPKDPIPA
jgi:glycosyltransferase involved in cell wall biosynthesis